MGSGKSTASAELAALLNVPHIPVDELHTLDGALDPGEWRGSAMDLELLRRMDAAVACSGGWVVEANPWQIPTWLFDDLGADVLWLDYDNYVRFDTINEGDGFVLKLTIVCNASDICICTIHR